MNAQNNKLCNINLANSYTKPANIVVMVVLEAGLQMNTTSNEFPELRITFGDVFDRNINYIEMNDTFHPRLEVLLRLRIRL